MTMTDRNPNTADELAAERRRLEHNLARRGKGLCMDCSSDIEYSREELTILMATFHDHERRTIKSRTVGRLCPEHLQGHPFWNKEKAYV